MCELRNQKCTQKVDENVSKPTRSCCYSRRGGSSCCCRGSSSAGTSLIVTSPGFKWRARAPTPAISCNLKYGPRSGLGSSIA